MPTNQSMINQLLLTYKMHVPTLDYTNERKKRRKRRRKKRGARSADSSEEGTVQTHGANPPFGETTVQTHLH
jgi:hypothetical protein